jgi:hypothetical protein
MSAQLVSLIACRTYAVAVLAVAVLVLTTAAAVLYWSAYGFPSELAAVFSVPPESFEKQILEALLVRLGPVLLVIGLILVAVGVLAWLRFISAMIAGCLVLALRVGWVVTVDSEGTQANTIEALGLLVLITLTAVAAIARRPPRSAIT